MHRILHKALRITFVTITALVVVVAMLFSAFMLPPVQNYMRNVAKTRAEEALGTRVEIGRLVYFPFKTIGFDKVVVYGVDSLPMISMAAARVDIGLETLWNDRLIISSITADSICADIHNVGDSALNIKAFMTLNTTQDESENEEEEDASRGIEIRSILNRRGEIRYDSHHVSDIHLEANNIIIDNGIAGADIEELSFVDRKHGRLSGMLRTEVKFYSDTLSIARIDASYGASNLSANDIEIICDSTNMMFDAHLNRLHIDTNTLRKLSDKLPENEVVNVSGQIKGAKDWTLIRDLSINNDKETVIKGEAKFKGYNDWRTAHIDIECEQATTTVADIAAFTSKETDKELNKTLGRITYKGKLTGDISDLNYAGTITSSIGKIETTGKAELKANDDIHFAGSIATDGLDLTKLTSGTIGNIRFTQEIDGQFGHNEPAFAHLKGDLQSIEVNGYTFKDLVLDGVAAENNYSGLLTINDPNGSMVLVGEYANDTKDKHLVVTALIDDFYTGRTHITPTIDGCLNLSMRADFSGPDIDHAQGEMWIDGFSFVDSTRQAKSGTFVADVKSGEDGYKKIDLKSDHINGHLEGHFMYADLYGEIYSQIFQHANALLTDSPSNKTGDVEAKLSLDYTDADQYLKFLTDSIELKDKGKIEFDIASATHSSHLNINIGDIEIGDIKIRGLKGKIECDTAGIAIEASTEKLRLPSIGTMGEVDIKNMLTRNRMSTDLTWDNYELKNTGGKLQTTTQFKRIEQYVDAIVDIEESPITLNGNLCTMHKSSMEISHNYLSINGFRFDNGERYLTVNGTASENLEDTLYVGMNKVVIENFIAPDPYERYALAGDLSANVDLIGLFDSPIINGNVKIDRFSVDEDDLEKLELATKWSAETKQMDVDVAIVTGGKPRAHALGAIDINNNYMDLDFDIDSLSIGFLNYYLNGSISDIKGTTSGKLQLYGPLDKIALDAKLTVNKTDFTVKSTQVSYSFNANDTVILSPNNMIFRGKDINAPGMKVVDRSGAVGYFGGNIEHDMFTGLNTKIYFLVKNMLVLDLKESDNPTYYGKIYADGRLDVTGPTSNINIAIDAETCPKTTFSILPTAKSDRSGNSSYIKFKKNETNIIEEEAEKRKILDDIEFEKINSFVTADIDVKINPTAQIDVILDPRTDNKISANGQGKLKLIVDKSGNLILTGPYTIDAGTYNFSYANLVNKRFTISNGGMITWDGDAFNPVINIMATYKLKASLYDLVQSNAEGQDLTKRVPINVNLFLSERMADPNIRFKIEIPSTMNFNQYTLDQYISTEEETNRQVFSLLLANRFHTSQDATGTGSNTSSSSYIGTTVSELLSNQLSNWISQNKYNLGIGVNYRPGDEVTQEEYEVAVSTQVLNNKIILSGNIGYGRNNNSTEASEGSVIGDFDMEVKINKKGNLRAKAYTHSNNDVIYETSPTTQGVGITFREDFNSFSELFKKYWNFITRKRKKEVIAENIEQ